MSQRIKQKIYRVSSNEKGSASMYFIIFMMFFLPFAIWVGVQLPLKYETTYTVKQMVSNTADSIISQLDNDALARGVVSVKANDADEIAREMIHTTLNTDEEGQPSGEGILKDPVPIHSPLSLDDITSLPQNEETGEYILPQETGVYVYIINNPPKVIDIEGLLPIDHTSVVVHANIPVTANGTTVIHRTGVSEAQIHTGRES